MSHKPCPWCGNHSVWYTDQEKVHGYMWKYWVSCECGARSQTGMTHNKIEFKDKSRFEKIWNNRKEN